MLSFNFSEIGNDVDTITEGNITRLDFWYRSDMNNFAFEYAEKEGWRMLNPVESKERNCFYCLKNQKREIHISCSRDSYYWSFPARGIDADLSPELRIKKALEIFWTSNKKSGEIVDMFMEADSWKVVVDYGEQYCVVYHAGMTIFEGCDPKKVVIGWCGLESKEVAETRKNNRFMSALEEAAMMENLERNAWKENAERESEKEKGKKKFFLKFW